MTTNPTTPTTDGQLQPARQALNHAISQLIDPRPQTHNGELTWLDSLYDQLADATSGTFLGRTGLQRSQPPIWIDAADLLNEIHTTIRTWHPENLETVVFYLGARIITARIPKQHPINRRLGLLNEYKWRPQDTTHITNMANQIQRWTKNIETLFTETHTKHLPAPCPACNVQTVYRIDAAGERVRQPALQITSAGCQCVSCRHTWEPQYFMHLARVLGYQLPEGVLE